MVCRRGWSKPGLEFVGDDEKAVFGPLEGLGGLGLGEAVHTRLGVVLPAILYRAGEGDEGFEGIARRSEILVDLDLVSHRMEPGARDDHGLGPAADLALGAGGEVLHHDADLLLIACSVRSTKALRRYSAFFFS